MSFAERNREERKLQEVDRSLSGLQLTLSSLRLELMGADEGRNPFEQDEQKISDLRAQAFEQSKEVTRMLNSVRATYRTQEKK